MPKVVLLGAGSVTFTRKLLADLLTDADLPPLAIALHDIDERRLAEAEALARAMAAKLGSPATVTAHPSRRRFCQTQAVTCGSGETSESRPDGP